MQKIVAALRRFTLTLLACLMALSNTTTAMSTYQYDSLNDILWHEDCGSGGADASIASGNIGTSSLEGSDNQQKVWNYLKSKGFSDEQAAAIMGNFAWESGDPTFNKATSSEQVDGGGGFGIAQWTGGRRTEITQAASNQGKNLIDLSFQLDYFYTEMQTRTERDGGKTIEEDGFKKINNLEEATEYFMYNHERPKSAVAALQERIDYAKQFLAKYGGSGSGGGSAGDSCTCTTTSSRISSTPTAGDAGTRIQKAIDEAIADSKNQGVDLRIMVSGDASASGGVGGQTPSASTIKLLVAAALSDKKVPLSSISNDLLLMIRDSNNDAANRLIDKAGGFGPINAMASKLGAEAHIGRKMMESPGASDPNTISAKGSDTILTAIKQSEGGGGKIGQDYASAIMSAMKAQTINTKWGSSGIPKDKMAHKTGELGSSAQHDVGFFFNGDKWLTVSTLSSGSESGGVNVVKTTAKKIYDAWLGSRGGESSGATSPGGCGSDGTECGQGGLIGTLKCYAWPEYSTRTDQMPDYTAAVERASSEGRYIGGAGGGVKGDDCGAFVTILLNDSGFIPGYNSNGKGGNTVSQYAWAKENMLTLGKGNEINVADLQPGDVANDEMNHTFMYVGLVDGFEPTGIASASVGGPPRAPMAGHENPTSSNWTWFRKI